MTITDAQIKAQILQSLKDRADDHSACPSEIARALAPSGLQVWRALMPRIRQVLTDLILENRVVVTRGPRILPPSDLGGGPIRIRRGPRFIRSEP